MGEEKSGFLSPLEF